MGVLMVSMVIHGTILSVLNRCFKDVLRKFYISCQIASKVLKTKFQKCSKQSLGRFQGCVNSVSKALPGVLQSVREQAGVK